MTRRNYLITMIGTVDTGKLERFMVMTQRRAIAISIARECADKQNNVEGFKVAHRTRQGKEWRIFAQEYKPFARSEIQIILLPTPTEKHDAGL